MSTMAITTQQKKKITIRIQRGTRESGTEMKTYTVEVEPGSVVLDAVHAAQAQDAPDLAVRWNCKAGKCGSCAAEVDGHPKLMCMTRLSDFPKLENGGIIDIRPMQTYPLIKDLVTDTTWNFDVNTTIRPFSPPQTEQPLIMSQREVDRIQEFRKCIQCGLCNDACHVLRTHQLFDSYAGPMNVLRLAGLEMHPQDQDDRMRDAKDKGIAVGYCNITRCCTEVCPENIRITDNAIIPIKERVASRFYDPLTILLNVIFRRNKNRHKVRLEL